MPGLLTLLLLFPSLIFSTSMSPQPIAAGVVAHVVSERLDAAAAVVAAAPVTPPPAPNPSNLLVSENGTLRVDLGIYNDCSGWSPVGHELAYMNICYGRTYFIGHNPGVFTPLLNMQPGDVITWYDGDSFAHRLKIVSVRVVSRFGGVPVPVNANVVAQFQTCEVLDGTFDRILDAEIA